MAIPWVVLDRFETEDEGTLELRRRGKGDYLITVGNQILMNSKAQRSEIALGKLGCRTLPTDGCPQILVGGLGMGITLRAVLDNVPSDAQVTVVELNSTIKTWCLGPLAELTDGAASDPRVFIEIADVAAVIQRAKPSGHDALILDLYRGPGPHTDAKNDPLYGSRAIERCHRALKPGGVLAVWGENPDAAFEQRLRRAGFSVRVERPGKGGYRHAVWLATKKKATRPTNAKGH